VQPLDPDSLRAYVARPWDIVAERDLAERVARPVDEKVATGIALYEAAKATVPGWPSEDDRLEDLKHHVAVRQILVKVHGVRAR
jgi:hypothetical protein